MKKSITILGRIVDHAYLIKDINIDSISMEKYSVECRNTIDDAWGGVPPGQTTLENQDDQVLEIILKDKISNITLTARPNVIETIARLGGKIIKDFNVETTKRGKKAYLSSIEFFKEPVQKD